MAFLTARLAGVLTEQYGDWATGPLVPIGQGLECVVFRADSPRLGPLALRVPWQRWTSTDNDPAGDARQALLQEAALADHLRRYGVPAPAVYHVHLGDDLDFLVSDYVEHDASEVRAERVGDLVATIHAAPAIAYRWVAADGPSFTATLARRLIRRLAVLERLTQQALPLPSECEVQAVLDASAAPACILHLDVRPGNVLGWQGEVVGLVDWGNALLGDPALELARIAEYGFGGPGFLAGYAERLLIPARPAAVEVLYRLDAAAMLAIVFLSEHPDPARAASQVQRVCELLRAYDDAGPSA